MFGVEALYVDGKFKKFPNKQFTREERGGTDEAIYAQAVKEAELLESTFPRTTHLQFNEDWDNRDVYEIVQKAYKDTLKRIVLVPTSVQASDTTMGGNSGYDNFIRPSDLEYDILSTHPYSFVELFQAGGPDDLISPPEDAFKTQLVDIQEHLTDKGLSKELWITENGWNSSGEMTEKRQASYLMKSVFIAMAQGVGKYFIYQLLDKGGEAGTLFHTTGIITSGGDKKLAYLALEQLMADYGHLYYKETIQEDENLFKYIYTDGNKDYEVAWFPKDPDTYPAITGLLTSEEDEVVPEAAPKPETPVVLTQTLSKYQVTTWLLLVALLIMAILVFK